MTIVCEQSRSSRLRTSVAVFLLVMAGIAHAAVPVTRPTDDSYVVLQLATNGAEPRFARLRKAVLVAPQDVEALALYVEALIDAGKQTGNERYYGYAEQALHTAPQAAQHSLQLKQAQLLQHRHAFQKAEQLLNELLAKNPRARDARLMRSQVRLHLQNPEYALRDCVALVQSVDLLTSTTCIAQARAALGDVTRAYALVAAVLQTQSAPNAARSWSAGVAAELAARLGHNDEATKWYRLAYELDKESHYPRIAYADWLLSQGLRNEAAAVASSGRSNADKLRVVIAERNAQSLAAQQLQLGWAEAKANGERNHLRDQARFELAVLHDVARAHATALNNFRDHREAEDALVLAATALLLRDKSALASLQAWREERRYVDVRLESSQGIT